MFSTAAVHLHLSEDLHLHPGCYCLAITTVNNQCNNRNRLSVQTTHIKLQTHFNICMKLKVYMNQKVDAGKRETLKFGYISHSEAVACGSERATAERREENEMRKSLT